MSPALIFSAFLSVLLGASSSLTHTGLLSDNNPPPPHFASVGFSSPVRSVCKPIPSTLSLCHGVGYREMRVPNLLGHDSVREAQQQSSAWLPLVSKRCHRDTGKFLCSLLAPVCLAELTGPVRPCRALCAAVRDGCAPVMSAFGFPWPEMFNCSRFPTGDELCIPATGEPGTATGEPGTATGEPGTGAPGDGHDDGGREEASKGAEICGACVQDKEGETDIKNNFCSSPYAFKLRLGGVSWVGGARRLVPLGRSRILRWAGGGAERAEGVGGAMAHSALWLASSSEEGGGGGACSCPGLEAPGALGEGGGGPGGWFLGLARVRDGRLVLSRLLRWSRGDGELRRFVRGLLRRPCPPLDRRGPPPAAAAAAAGPGGTQPQG